MLNKQAYWSNPSVKEHIRLLRDAVCDEWGVSGAELISKIRKRVYTEPRYVYAYLLTKRMKMRSLDVGAILRYSDSSSIRIAVSAVESWYYTDKKFHKRMTVLSDDVLFRELNAGFAPFLAKDCYRVLQMVIGDKKSTPETRGLMLKVAGIATLKPEADLREHSFHREIIKIIET
jgi:hypothetical protein